jgi:hypothetical protein
MHLSAFIRREARELYHTFIQPRTEEHRRCALLIVYGVMFVGLCLIGRSLYELHELHAGSPYVTPSDARLLTSDPDGRLAGHGNQLVSEQH